jgi:hypothetical protein
VRLNGAFTQHQAFGHSSVGVPLGDEDRHLPLARGQSARSAQESLTRPRIDSDGATGSGDKAVGQTFSRQAVRYILDHSQRVGSRCIGLCSATLSIEHSRKL